MKHPEASERECLPTDVPPRVLERIKNYISMLDRWRRVTNLISERGFQDVWCRHVADGLSLQRTCENSKRWLDIGSGAGFPAIIVASVLAENLGVEVNCVESDKRKCAFLREVSGKLGLPLRVHNVRAETLTVNDTGRVDVVTARAFSSIQTILTLADEYMSQGARAALPRGKTWTREIETIDRDRYRVTTCSVRGDGAVVMIEKRVVSSSDDS